MEAYEYTRAAMQVELVKKRLHMTTPATHELCKK